MDRPVLGDCGQWRYPVDVELTLCFPLLNVPLFDFAEWADEWTRIQRDVISQLADGITVQTFRAVLSGVE